MRTAVMSKALLLSLLVACLLAATVGSRPAAADFADVPPDHYAYVDVGLLVSLGMVGGYWDGLYHPEYVVDRGQMAAYVGRTLRSRMISAKPGYVQHIDGTSDFVCAPAEPRASSYKLYVSTDNALTWSLDAASAGGPGPFFGGQFVYWTVIPSPGITYYRPVAVVGANEVPLCAEVAHHTWTEGGWTGTVTGHFGSVGGLPWLCWDPYPYSDRAPCVAFYVIYVTGGGPEQYLAIVDPDTTKLVYGREVGSAGVLASYVTARSLPPGSYHAMIQAVDFVGLGQAALNIDFTVVGP